MLYRFPKHISEVFCEMIAFCTLFTLYICEGWFICLFEYLQKTTDLLQVTDKLYLTMLHRVHLAKLGFELKTLVVIGTDCKSSCKTTIRSRPRRPLWGILLTRVKHLHNCIISPRGGVLNITLCDKACQWLAAGR